MLIELSAKDKILDTKPFIDEEVRFNLLHLIRESKSSYLLANKNNTVIIGQSAPKYAAWIWTSNKISNKEIDELKGDLVELFKDRDKLTFVAKPDIALILADHYSAAVRKNYSIDLKMQSFHCPSMIEPIAVQGHLEKPKMHDVEVISKFFAEFIYNCFGKKTTAKEQVETIKMYIKSEKFYIWCNNDEIISMANIAHCSQRHARINEVYTKPDRRGKGFGQMIVAQLCRIIYGEHRIPVLYTDVLNPASNKAYKNIGFIECGQLTQISL